jgi:hypothetical protein
MKDVTLAVTEIGHSSIAGAEATGHLASGPGKPFLDQAQKKTGTLSVPDQNETDEAFLAKDQLLVRSSSSPESGSS